jgi:hypothetical protein
MHFTIIKRTNGKFARIYESETGSAFRLALLACDPFQTAVNTPPYITGLILEELN